MQCAVQWVQQKEGFGIGQHTPSSGWVLYYIATHRACCTSGLNQKLNQKSWNHLKAGRNHFVFIWLSSVWNSFSLLVKWLYETSSADCSPHDPLLQKPDHRTLQLIFTSPLINICWLHPLLARYAQWNPGTHTYLETSTHKEGSQKNRISIFALYLQNEAKV